MDTLISNQFSTSGSGQTGNTQLCVFAYFQFDHFLKSKFDFISRFQMRISIFNSKKNFGAFWSVFEKSKMDFPLYFKNVI